MHQPLDPVSRPIDGAAKVLASRRCPRDEIEVRLEACADHADGVADVTLVIDDVLLRKRMQEFPIGRHHHRPRDFVDAPDVVGGDFCPTDRDHSVGRLRLHVLARDSREHALDAHARHELRLLHRGRHGGRGLLQVRHHVASDPGGA